MLMCGLNCDESSVSAATVRSTNKSIRNADRKHFTSLGKTSHLKPEFSPSVKNRCSSIIAFQGRGAHRDLRKHGAVLRLDWEAPKLVANTVGACRLEPDLRSFSLSMTKQTSRLQVAGDGIELSV